MSQSEVVKKENILSIANATAIITQVTTELDYADISDAINGVSVTEKAIEEVVISEVNHFFNSNVK